MKKYWKSKEKATCVVTLVILVGAHQTPTDSRTNYYNDLIKMAPEIEHVKTMLLT